ncbi:MAG TPA: hypothetical protein PKY19_06025 [Oscillospiraceae bacterium]|nr:hypothetical protein [Oscillospiraceae bacterium]
MNNNNSGLTPAQQQMLLKLAGEKLGINPADLEQAIRSNSFDSLKKRAGPRIDGMLSDPKALEALLNDPKTIALLKKLAGGG